MCSVLPATGMLSDVDSPLGRLLNSSEHSAASAGVPNISAGARSAASCWVCSVVQLLMCQLGPSVARSWRLCALHAQVSLSHVNYVEGHPQISA